MIKMIIADDSAFMRKLLSDLFTQQDDFMVIDTARNGKEAIEKIRELKPDLVTMDVNMPIMDGLEALEILMKECRIPVVMISSLTKTGTDATIKALSLGAVDFIEKVSGPISSITKIQTEILEKCRAAVTANVRNYLQANTLRSKPIVSALKPPNPAYTKFPVDVNILKKDVNGLDGEKIIAIGTSTGGPRALQQVITKLPRDLPCGVVIVQHMPAGFTKSLAERLNSLSDVEVKEAEHNDVVSPGKVYIAPGNYHMTVELQGRTRVIALNQNPPLSSHRPAVDILFDSVAKLGNRVVSVILTGMGSDGAKGMTKIKSAGGYIIAEDESTSVVYGMPKSVVELGIADQILPVDRIADVLVNVVKK